MRPVTILVLLALPCLAEEPRFEPVLDNALLQEGALWLFVVEDDQGQLVASCERNQQLRVGVLDLSGRAPRVTWRAVDGGDGVADHWHVFAHGRHWLSCSTHGARKSRLIALDRSLAPVGSWQVANDEKAGPGGVPTNDHFLVAEEDGVAVGHFLPGQGHRIFRFSKEGDLLGKIDVGGREFRHANGSSANPVGGGFALWASGTLDPRRESRVSWIELDEDWKANSMRATIEEDHANLSMPTAAKLPSGAWVVHLRVIEGVSDDAAPSPKGKRPRDMGDIVRYVVAEDGTHGGRTLIADGEYARPHTLLAGDRLITTWDGGRGIVWIRVDRVR